jgi:hypothetical protein
MGTLGTAVLMCYADSAKIAARTRQTKRKQLVLPHPHGRHFRGDVDVLAHNCGQPSPTMKFLHGGALQ